MATEEVLPKQDPYQIVRGFPCPLPFPNSTFFLKKHVEEAMDYIPRQGDLIIASYPKTGTTWMQYIVMQIVTKATEYYSFEDVTHKIYPYMEATGTAAVDALTGDRIYKHHMPYNLVQKREGVKTIYTYRHPEDTFVSYYHFYQSLDPLVPLNFEQFFDNFITGKIAYGSYFKHMLSFYKHQKDKNLLMVSYEKLHADRRNEILRVAKFMGEDHYEYLTAHEDLLEKVMERTSFDYMKRNLSLTNPRDAQKENKSKVNFFRKGIVGDGKNVLSEEKREKIRKAAEVLKGTTVYEEWYPQND